MKKLVFFFLVVFAATSFAQDSTGTTGFSLTLTVKNISSDEGKISVALCNSSENYTNDDDPFIGKLVDIKDGIAVIVYENIPSGEYGVKLYHDEDGNGKLNTNFLGIPSEDYAFSNNAKGSFGPASWEDAKFSVGGNTEISIELD